MNATHTLLPQCHWPDLAPLYAGALQEAVRYILEHFADVQGIIVSGTIVRGNPAPSSDLDIYVIRKKLQRQRIQKFFQGIPAEIFVNPAKQVIEYLEQEHQHARPITAHMLATGFTILELDPIVDKLRQRARAFLDRQPDPDAQTLTTVRYMCACRYEDATDIVSERPETARMILNLAVYDMLRYRFWLAKRYQPRDKDLLLALEDLDPDLAVLACDFYAAHTLSACLPLAERIAERTIKAYGFFEWESEPEDLK